MQPVQDEPSWRRALRRRLCFLFCLALGHLLAPAHQLFPVQGLAGNRPFRLQVVHLFPVQGLAGFRPCSLPQLLHPLASACKRLPVRGLAGIRPLQSVLLLPAQGLAGYRPLSLHLCRAPDAPGALTLARAAFIPLSWLLRVASASPVGVPFRLKRA